MDSLLAICRVAPGSILEQLDYYAEIYRRNRICRAQRFGIIRFERTLNTNGVSEMEMTPEIEAAVIRCRLINAFPLDGDLQENLETIKILADAYLDIIDARESEEAERGKLVDREWLESLGFKSESGRFARGQLQFTQYERWNAWWSVSGHPHASSRLVDGLNTRGAVLDLLSALGANPHARKTGG